jgi:hypothetical protein
MMMIVIEVHLKQGAELEWDGVMRERLTAARKQPGGSAGSSSSRRSVTPNASSSALGAPRSDWEK